VQAAAAALTESRPTEVEIGLEVELSSRRQAVYNNVRLVALFMTENYTKASHMQHLLTVEAQGAVSAAGLQKNPLRLIRQSHV